MGYPLNRLDEPVFMAVPKALQTEFGIHYRLESCVPIMTLGRAMVEDFVADNFQKQQHVFK